MSRVEMWQIVRCKIQQRGLLPVKQLQPSVSDDDI